MSHKHEKIIIEWARGAQIEYFSQYVQNWLITLHPLWDDSIQYRVYDPYRTLKEAAEDPTKQVRHKGSDIWFSGGEGSWTWCYPPEEYEVRDKPKLKKKKKMWQWLYQQDDGFVYMTTYFYTNMDDIKCNIKVLGPAPWTEIEVEED